MEDIVGVEVRLRSGESRYLLTWGRVHDPVDPLPLAKAVASNLKRFPIDGQPVAVRILWSLQPASRAPHFFEALVSLAQNRVPFGDGYEEWRAETRRAIDAGDQIWYLGHYAHDQPDEWEVTFDT